MIRIGHRFMTGPICSTTGEYAFDGYTDATGIPLLTADERQLSMRAGNPFPKASADNKDAYWKFVDGQ